MRRSPNQINDLRDAVLPLLGAGRGRLRPRAQLSSAQVERFNKLRNQSFSPQKGHYDRAKALTVRLLWMLWIAVEKAQKSLPTASQPS